MKIDTREARRAIGMTQRELASKSGVSESTIANIERCKTGDVNISLNILSKLVHALKCEVKDIYTP